MSLRPSSSFPRDLFLERHLLLRPGSARETWLEVRYSSQPDGTPNDALGHSPFGAELPERVARAREILHDAMSVGDGYAFDRESRLLGQLLFRIALPEPVARCLQRDLDEATRTGRRVRLWVDDWNSAVSGWPWEHLYDEGSLGFLALHPACSLVRTCRAPEEPAGNLVRTRGSGHAAGTGSDLEVLIVWADPQVEFEPLYAEAQVRNAVEFFSGFGMRCRVLWPRWCQEAANWPDVNDPSQVATKANLERELRERPPHVAYFVCHGDFAENEGYIALEGPERVFARRLAQLLGSAGAPRIVFFEACNSGCRGPTGRGTSVADTLAAPGRIVLGMETLWPAPASLPFWGTLFQCLVQPGPQPVDVALSAARESLHSEGSPYWRIPVLYRPLPRQLGITGDAMMAERPPAGVLAHQLARELAGRMGLKGEEQRLLGLVEEFEQKLDSLLREQGGASTKDIAKWDPCARLLLGNSEQPVVETSPVWFTSLLAPPRQLSWQSTPSRPGPWQVEISTVERDLLLPPGDIPSVSLPADQLPAGEEILWKVYSLGAGNQLMVQGMFKILPQAEAAEAILQFGEVDLMTEESARVLATTDVCARYRLYDDLVGQLRPLAETERGTPAGYLVRRALARMYAAMFEEMQQFYGRGIPEVEWAARRANEYARESYESLGLK